jgi:hypothetical protein
MNFEYDIFISYAHIDDLSPTGEEEGWIDLLHKRLSVLLAQSLGYELKIWRDGHNLQGNDELDGAIGTGVTRSLLLVPVISPRYVQSDWCNREMEAFHAGEPPPSAAAPGFRRRVFKVIKTPLPEHLKKLEPRHISNLVGYEFYGKDDASGLLSEFSTDPKDKHYWQMLNRLVANITKTIIELKHSPGAQQPDATAIATTPDAAPSPAMSAAAANAATAPPNTVAPETSATPTPDGAGGAATKFVYLAETTGDLSKERALVADELHQRGFGVLPEQKLPLDERRRTEEAVREALARCALSVHLVGARYGSTPEDDAASIVRIQEELAAERGAKEASFQRLIWLPPGLATPALEISDARQKAYVEELQTRVTAGAELLQMTVEDLKTRVVEKLTPTDKTPARGERRSKVKRVYLICENRDRSFVRPIRDYLFKENFEVITWLDEGAADKLMDYHRKNLRECDAALIYFGNGDEPWVRKNIEDLEKAYGYGRDDDWSASAVYVGAPPDDWKEDFRTHDVPYVIHNFSAFDPKDLSDFVSAVRAANGGQG